MAIQKKERPILFTGDMVKSILRGSKTVTRRVVMTQPVLTTRSEETPAYYWLKSKLHYSKRELVDQLPDLCPYGIPGDLLWVRETWKVASFMEGDPMRFQYRADMGEAWESERDFVDEVKYEEWFERVCIQSTDYLEKIKWTNKDDDGVYRWDNGMSPLPWRPSIYMPRWASRITLEIMSVKVERVQDITWREVIPEGVSAFTVARGAMSDNPPDPRWKFIEVWNKINAGRGFGWDTNPWVWVIEFKKI